MPIPPGPRQPTPKWIWFAAAGIVLVGGYVWWKNKSKTNQPTAPSPASAPTLESTGFLSGVTDQSNNLPWEDTWPYNQLALPYNYTNQQSSYVNANANLLMPYSTDSTLSTPVGS